MRAVYIEAQGSIDELKVGEWPDPSPGPGEVVIDVKACSLNYLDIFVVRGMPGLPVPMPRIPGGDFSGIVREAGEGVDPAWVGRRVLVDPLLAPGRAYGEHANGGLCERIAVPAANLIALSAAVSFEDAAALPIAYGTAQRMMVTRGQVAAGELVMILGASGGVGTGCVQIAKARGATVIACASSQAKLDRLSALGADHLVDYSKEDFSRAAWAISGKQGVDVVVNYTGGDTWVPSLRCLKRFGRLLTCGATAGYDPKEDIRYIWRREVDIRGSDGWSRQDLVDLLAEVERAGIKPVIDHVYPLDEAREAFRVMEQREVFGKLVIAP